MTQKAKTWGKWEDSESYGLFTEWLHSSEFSTSQRADILDWCDATEKDRSKILDLSVKWAWFDRAKDYDQWRAMQPICKVAPLFSHMAETMHRIVTEELKRMEEYQSNAVKGIPTMKHRDIIRMVEQLRKAEEFCIEAMERKESALSSGRVLYDFTKCSVEELRQMEDISEKAKVDI